MNKLGSQGFFLAYPGGSAAVALFLLRLTVGATIIVQGAIPFSFPQSLPAKTVGISVVGLLSGSLLVAGFRTSLAGVLAVLDVAALASPWSSKSTPNLIEDLLPALLTGAMAVAIPLLGPGAYSVDARLFGRREIVIPPPREHDA